MAHAAQKAGQESRHHPEGHVDRHRFLQYVTNLGQVLSTLLSKGEHAAEFMDQVGMCIYLPIYVPTYPPTYLSTYPSSYLPTYISISPLPFLLPSFPHTYTS